MLFSSVEFLLLFLPCSVGLYYLTPRRWRNALLLLESLLFYAWGEPRLCLLMLTVALLHFALGWQMGRTGHRRLWLVLTLCVDIGLLVFFKYTDLLLRTVGFSPLGLALPLGISFYLFQAMSYVVDVYRGEVAWERDPIAFGLYLCFYPQLIAGPIVRYGDLRSALDARRESVEQIARGIRLLAVGLCKKVLFANTAGELWQLFRTLTAQNRNPLGAWCGLLCFSLQIYYDFSGYSDMAVGLGRMFGFSLPKNFDYPYTATSVREFWHRWHITLSAWFREYVYIPLGGSRCGTGRVLFNLFVTWALTGLWHGAAWNFLLWGVYFFLLLALERFAWGDAMKRWPSILRHGYLLLAVGLGWLIFAFDGGGDGLGFRDGIVLFSTMWNLPEITNFSANIWFELMRNLPILTLMCIGSTPLAARLAERLCKRHPRGGEICLSVLAVFGILLSLASLTREGYNPFLYFRF